MSQKHDFEHMPGVLFCKDLEGRYMWANQGLLDMLHIEMQDLVGKDDWALNWEPEQIEYIQAMDKAVVDEQQTLTCVEHLQRGEEEWDFVTYKTPWRDEFGEIIGVQGCSLRLDKNHLTDLQWSN